MHRQPNNSIYKSVVVVWLTLSVASVVLAAATWSDLSTRLEATRKATTIREELDSILRVLLSAETAQRGFTMTGDERFLGPMPPVATALSPHFDRLAEATREDSDALKRIMDLRAQAEVLLTHHQEILSVRRAEGPAAAAAVVASGDGRRLMESIRGEIESLRGLHAVLLNEGGSRAQSELRRASVTSLLAGILGICSGGFAFWLARVMLGHQQRERRLVEQRLEAERSSREKTVFLANVSHEIRTPMNAILGFSELLANQIQHPRQRHYLDAIRTSATSLLQLINDILDMSKIEAGVLSMRLEPTDPREICDFLRTVFSEPISRKGLRLDCLVAEDLPRALLMDRIRLRQVLVNLVGNAVKFTDQGSIEVRVQWAKQDSGSHVTLFIEVQDTGLGIPPDKLDAIFSPFVQAGTHIEKEKSGTGLGLAIVRRLTEMMGGTVTAASVMGQGSAFSLKFPDIAISARLASRDSAVSVEAVDFNRLRPSTILVVDDQEANCQLVAGMLEGSHHRLVFGSDGTEAIERARTDRPDLVLMDLRMPGMGGREALSGIRGIPGLELTPVIAVTASNLLHDDPDLQKRFDGYVRKPFSTHELFRELSQFLPPRTAESLRESGSSDLRDEPPPPLPVEIAAELRRLAEHVWPGLRDSLAINETKDFAARLERLAGPSACPPLAAYAQSLAHFAEDYSIVDVEIQLAAFPQLVERLCPNATS